MSLPLCVLLSDAPAIDPSTAYNHAEQSFFHGYLGESQRESAWGYARFLYSAPSWARKFQVLEATVMVWQGLSEDALKVLSDSHVANQDSSLQIEEFAIKATALTHLHRLEEADSALVQAHQLCAQQELASCGSAYRADGLLAMERGQPTKGRSAALQALAFARLHNDGSLETTALLDLGLAAAEWERHNEAIEYFRQAETKARQIAASSLLAFALGNEGWEEFSVGNYEKALTMFQEASRRSASVSATGGEVQWLLAAGLAYAATGQDIQAEKADLRAMALAKKIGDQQSIINASEDLARIYISHNRAADADRYAEAALLLARQTGNQLDFIECSLLQGQAAALGKDWQRAEGLLHTVASSSDGQVSQRWRAQHALGQMYEAKGDEQAALRSYEAALALIESARAGLHHEVSQLSFLENASSIYDDYIHLLVHQGRTQEALEAADWSRARTLQEGLELNRPRVAIAATDTAAGGQSARAPKLRAADVARKTNSTLLFYWLGKTQSYLWVITSEETRLVQLPPRAEIMPVIERYRRAILGLKDPLRTGTADADDGATLYRTLIAPVSAQLRRDRQVVLFVDGEMGQLNLETLTVPVPAPHFWIEDATVLSAPSIRMFGAATSNKRTSDSKAEARMLLLGNVVSSSPEFPPLPMADQEVQVVGRYFTEGSKIFEGTEATPHSYLASHPEHFEYIHFVTHGTASRTDPLESAVILSEGGGADGYKLYAHEILTHPINARLVTISACNSSGSKSFAGEGLVGLSWAFLRAGAHNAIGSLWEVSDASTPALMDKLYDGLQSGAAPASALRSAKLSLIHSGGHFNRPFYWAPFQLYAGS